MTSQVSNLIMTESPLPVTLAHQINILSFPFYGFTNEKQSIPNDTEKLSTNAALRTTTSLTDSSHVILWNNLRFQFNCCS